MADGHQQEERIQSRPARLRLGRLALAAIALIAAIGAVVYTYNLGFRQGAKHAPPLITADPSPTKMPPASPGGIEIPHQDKLVYQRLSTSRAPSESPIVILLPPPEEPLPKPPRELEPRLASAAIADDAVSTPATLAPDIQTSKGGEAEVKAKVEAEAQPPPVQRATPPSPAPVSNAPAVKEPIKQAIAVAVATPATNGMTSIPTLKAPPITATYLLQLGSFRSDAAAQAGWRRLVKRHRAILELLPHRVAQADLGAAKGIYHRLQVGAFDSREGADTVCRQLKAQSQDCLIVKR